MRVLAIFGPTAVGKTAVAVEVAELLRARGEDPVAVSCDSMQVYRGLEALTGWPTAEQRVRLEHRLLGCVDVAEEFSAGRFAALAQAEIDALLAERRRPIVVGGTGLYLRAALSELDLRPPVAPEVRDAVEREIRERGAEVVHGDLDPELAATVHPNDRKRIARLVELQRAGIEPLTGSEGLWTARLRHPTVLVGLVMDREELAQRIDARVEEMARAGAAEEVRRALEARASRTVRQAHGFDEFASGALDAVKAEHRAFGRRQLTWMRKMQGVRLVDRTGRSDDEVAEAVVSLLDRDTAAR